jgi:DNA-binding response OmpR family regulator
MTPTNNKKILLAEDDASMRRYIEIVLKKEGFDVVTAEDGLAAMQIALNADFDLVVADAIMPNLTGYDLCRMLRGNDDKKTIPLVILSGLESAEKPDNLANAYLLKGENLKEQLIKTISGLLTKDSNS